MEVNDHGGTETAPVTGTNFPWDFQLDYKAGKTPQNYAGSATPEVAGAKFHYYDKDVKAKLDFTLPATLIICDVLSGISGTIEEEGRYSNFYSNKVRDSRNEAMRLYISGIDRPLLTGLYSQIKGELPKGAKYQMYLLCLEPASKKVFLVSVGATLSDQIKRAIGARSNTNPDKVNLFGLFEISTKWWFLKLSGKFEKVTKEGKPYDGKGDLFYVPEMLAGVFHDNNQPDAHELCEQARYACTEYIRVTQDRIWKAENTALANEPAPAVAAPAMSWPAAPPVVAEVPGDDLPF
jgi:hypothetical protein